MLLRSRGGQAAGAAEQGTGRFVAGVELKHAFEERDGLRDAVGLEQGEGEFIARLRRFRRLSCFEDGDGLRRPALPDQKAAIGDAGDVQGSIGAAESGVEPLFGLSSLTEGFVALSHGGFCAGFQRIVLEGFVERLEGFAIPVGRIIGAAGIIAGVREFLVQGACPAEGFEGTAVVSCVGEGDAEGLPVLGIARVEFGCALELRDGFQGAVLLEQ